MQRGFKAHRKPGCLDSLFVFFFGGGEGGGIKKFLIDKKKKNRKKILQHLPEQLWPSPMYPGLQLQLNEPSVLIQLALSLQL